MHLYSVKSLECFSNKTEKQDTKYIKTVKQFLATKTVIELLNPINLIPARISTFYVSSKLFSYQSTRFHRNAT